MVTVPECGKLSGLWCGALRWVLMFWFVRLLVIRETLEMWDKDGWGGQKVTGGGRLYRVYFTAAKSVHDVSYTILGTW